MDPFLKKTTYPHYPLILQSKQRGYSLRINLKKKILEKALEQTKKVFREEVQARSMEKDQE
jgi:hypothetical protein